MSIDIKWETLTSGTDGEALAENIRSFIDEKFQQVTLPRFIRSVHVHSFDFGNICPDLEIKDICDPLPDFYEDDGDEESSEEGEDCPQDGLASEQLQSLGDRWRAGHRPNMNDNLPNEAAISNSFRLPPQIDTRSPAIRSPLSLADHLGSPFLPRVGTPGIPGGTSNLSYFHLPLGGLSGTQTPLAAVAGGTPFSNGWHDHSNMLRDVISLQGSNQLANTHRQSEVASSLSRPSTANSIPAASALGLTGISGVESTLQNDDSLQDSQQPDGSSRTPPRRMRERRAEDLQVVCRVKYAGDVRLSLTAEILLDYPMPSFVGIPLKLNITGISFDGVAVLAYIRKRAQFCFLAPEDAEALVGAESSAENDPHGVSSGEKSQRLGGLLQEIKVESEIGRKENGKQVLKNVGKMEKFVLEQVRRIFEDEFVFPSFWTFLV